MIPPITNNSPLAVDIFPFMDAKAQAIFVMVVSATYEILPNAPPRLCDEQPLPRATDEYFGEPASSSVRYASDLSLHKVKTDVLLSGSAIAARGRVESMLTELRIADVHKQVLVSGSRDWMGVGRAALPTEPFPFERMPIVYERAFGGQAPYQEENPVGIGGSPTPEQIQTLGTQVPNLEYPNDRMRTAVARPRPAGFGPIAPWWAPRSKLGGTYDEAWLKEQSPLLPFDFDFRFFQVAPSDQQARRVQSGEPVQVRGMTPEGLWRFELPALDAEVRLLFAQKGEVAPLVLDTVHIDADSYRVTLTGRVVIKARRQNPLREVLVGPVTRGMWRARLTGKRYKRGLSEL